MSYNMAIVAVMIYNIALFGIVAWGVFAKDASGLWFLLPLFLMASVESCNVASR